MRSPIVAALCVVPLMFSSALGCSRNDDVDADAATDAGATDTSVPSEVRDACGCTTYPVTGRRLPALVSR